MIPSVRIASLCALVLLAGLVRAQNTRFVDSLNALVSTAPDDTNKLNMLWLLVDSTLDPLKRGTGPYNEQLHELSERLSQDPDPRIRRRAELGRAKYLCTVARGEELANQLVKALGHYEECAGILDAGDEPGLLEQALNKCGRVSFHLGIYSKALYYYKWYYRFAEERGDPAARANHFNRLGGLYEAENDLDKALEFQEMSLAEGRSLRDTMLIMTGLGNVASVRLERKELAQAEDLAREVLALAVPRNDLKYITGALDVIASVHVARKEYPEAEAIFLEILRLIEGTGWYNTRKGILIALAQNSADQGRPAEALERGRKALELAQQVGDQQDIYAAARLLEELHKRMGRSADALKMADLQLRMRDSLDGTRIVRELERYEYEKRSIADSLSQVNERARIQADHDLAIHRERNRRNVFMISGVGVLLLAAGLWNRLHYTRKAKREADALRHHAEASEKFKQQFLANMSHEIRTPMNAIMGMSAILKRNEHTPEQAKYLGAISQSSENLLVILNDILDLSKLEAGKIDLEQVPFDPRQVIGNVRDIIRFKAEEKGLSVDVSIAGDVPHNLLGDPTRLNQILLNLAGNAVKFTEKGRVTMAMTVRDAQEDHCALVIEVADTGIGIPEDRLEKIFEEFTQAYSDTTRKFGGTGLGLTISKRLAEMQGGSITVRSEKDKGSTFTVEIPYAIAPGDHAIPGQARDDKPGVLRDLRILLAEDNDFNAIVAQDELVDAIPGVRVDVAVNGRIAVEMAKVNDYDVILMDVQMPEMNGYDATKAIRALPGDKSHVPILAMTANVMKEEIERCTAAGMDGHVPKPFKREELLDALMAALARRPVVPGTKPEER